jgi:hypothetical protein
MATTEHHDSTAREIERTIALDECVNACRALHEINPRRAEPFSRVLVAAVAAGAKIATFRALTEEARVAYREEVAR